MAQKRDKAKGRRESGAFIPIPCKVINSENFKRLNGKAIKLLLDLCSQLRFKQGGTINNGDLNATMTDMRPRGWTSNETLDFAIKELLHYGFIIATRKPTAKKVCILYAVTWWAIDECNGKLDDTPTSSPPNNYHEVKQKWQRPKRKKKSLPRNTDISTSENGVQVIREHQNDPL